MIHPESGRQDTISEKYLAFLESNEEARQLYLNPPPCDPGRPKIEESSFNTLQRVLIGYAEQVHQVRPEIISILETDEVLAMQSATFGIRIHADIYEHGNRQDFVAHLNQPVMKLTFPDKDGVPHFSLLVQPDNTASYKTWLFNHDDQGTITSCSTFKSGLSLDQFHEFVCDTIPLH